MLWSTWLVANVCMWMNDVAAAWLMTSLTASPVWVALVQTAATCRCSCSACPAARWPTPGPQAATSWAPSSGSPPSRCACEPWSSSTLVSPPVLLALVFANGIGLAMRWPVFAAIVPELVPRPQLPQALALNGVSMNASRIARPAAGRRHHRQLGSAWVFALNAALSLVAAVVISRWQREHKPSPLGREPLLTAMRVGLQYVRQSAPLKGVLLRICIFFFHSTGLMALLPLLALGMEGGDAGTFTLLLAAMGSWRHRGHRPAAPSAQSATARRPGAARGSLLQAVAMAAMAWTEQLWMAPCRPCSWLAWPGSPPPTP
jgi:MFS family permease